MIFTNRLILRDLISEDFSSLRVLLSDYELTQHTRFASWSEEQTATWFKSCLEKTRVKESDVDNWAITLIDTSRFIGWLGIGNARHPTIEGERELGFFISRDAWGHGYMTEALRALLAYEFENRCTPQITATCDVNNLSSARVLNKVGMSFLRAIPETDVMGNTTECHYYTLRRSVKCS